MDAVVMAAVIALTTALIVVYIKIIHPRSARHRAEEMEEAAYWAELRKEWQWPPTEK
jgi:hypothetical protein